ASVDVVLNLTAGMGGDLVFGDVEKPLPLKSNGTDMAGATERVRHVAECLPEICTLDCGTMNFSLGDYVMTNTPSMLREMARQMTALGVRPEIEAFDTGHLWFAKQLTEEGLIGDPVLVQLCMGVPWGAPDDLNTFLAMVNAVPPKWTFSAFSIGRNALAYPAAAILAGGNVRVGLEDNLYVGKGQLATNGKLVERAVAIIEGMGARVIGPAEVREKLKLAKR
ncbi:MAG TPA: 3-keto-5-aminohexanoate cleavage protein, partial [Roseiarcus sp.]|nr:3-keto-5-aminohexanoate cleavage protein [Roseiarcus sp.]